MNEHLLKVIALITEKAPKQVIVSIRCSDNGIWSFTLSDSMHLPPTHHGFVNLRIPLALIFPLSQDDIVDTLSPKHSVN